MAQLKNLLVSGPSKFLGPIMGKLVGGASFTQPVNFVDDNALPGKNLEFILGIDSFANGGQMGWQNLSQVTVGNASNASQVPWSGVTNKPATFTPATHEHDTLYLKRAGDTLSSPLTVTGGDAANKGKIILDQDNQGQITDTGTATLFGFTSSNALTIGSTTYTTNIRGSSVSINGSEVALKSDIPTNYAGSSSAGGTAYTSAALVGTQAGASGVPISGNSTGYITYAYNINVGTTGNMPNVSNNANGVITINTHSGNYNHQLGFNNAGQMYYRAGSGTALTTSTSWDRVLTKTYGDSLYSEVGHTHNYSEVGHTHSTIEINGIADTTTYGTKLGVVQNATTGPQSGTWHNSIKILHNNSAGYYTQIAQNFTGTEGLWHRRMMNGAISSWRHVLDSVNYGDYAVTLTTAQTISGAKTFSGLITQGVPASHSTINNMNKFQSDLFVEGSGSAPNSPIKPGFYLGKSTSDENRHMDIVSGADYSYIDFNKASREEDYAVRLIANVSNGLTQFDWGTTSAITDKRLQIRGALDVINGITGILTGRINHPGISSSWWNGRINALVTQTEANGYSPIMSMKTTNGSWEVGHYNSTNFHNDFLINYKDDSTYNSSNNTVVHAVKVKKEGNIVLGGTDITLNSGSGTMRYNTTTKSIDFIFA